MIYIIFAYLNIQYTIEYYKEDKIEDICSEFASKNKIDKKKVIFKFKDNIVDQNQTLNQFLNNNIIININEFVIKVYDIPFSPISSSFFCTHKIKLIIITSIAVVLIIIILILILIINSRIEKSPPPPTDTTPTIQDSSETSNIMPDTSTLTLGASKIMHSTEIFIKCDVGFKLVDDKCSIDYFIKAVYLSKANENIRLISDEYSLNKIKKMIIDGKTVNPTKNFTFNENGTHIILYSFFPFNISTKNEAIGIFNGIENLLNVEFSSYNDDYPDVRFIKIFNNCINLISVDFSKISFYKTGHSLYDYSEYFNLMDYMFNNCINLKFVNFSITIAPYCIDILSSKFMFNNCISLTSIDLSVFCFAYGVIENYKSDLNNMFSNCISLKVINLGYDYHSDSSHPINMSYMFYNCSSLTSIDLSMIDVSPSDMSYMFAYCYQLKDIIFEGLRFTTALKYMSNAFRNCTFLVYADLYFHIDYVEDMSFMFYGCISLTNISILSFSTNNTVNSSKYMNYMFYDCRSLKSISHLVDSIILICKI